MRRARERRTRRGAKSTLLRVHLDRHAYIFFAFAALPGPPAAQIHHQTLKVHQAHRARILNQAQALTLIPTRRTRAQAPLGRGSEMNGEGDRLGEALPRRREP